MSLPFICVLFVGLIDVTMFMGRELKAVPGEFGCLQTRLTFNKNAEEIKDKEETFSWAHKPGRRYSLVYAPIEINNLISNCNC